MGWAAQSHSNGKRSVAAEPSTSYCSSSFNAAQRISFSSVRFFCACDEIKMVGAGSFSFFFILLSVCQYELISGLAKTFQANVKFLL